MCVYVCVLWTSCLTFNLLLYSLLTREYRGLCRKERELERELSTLTEALKDRAMERCVQVTPYTHCASYIFHMLL